MKKILFIFISLFCLKYNYALSQDMKIKWEDKDDIEFSIKVISGEFEYSMVSGDNIYYDVQGKVTQVGSVRIYYNVQGKVTQVGSVRIYYDVQGKVTQVGRLRVYYDVQGRVTSTAGKVN